MSNKVVKYFVINLAILLISIWSISHLIKSEELLKTNSSIDYDIEKLSHSNKRIIKEIHILSMYAIYNNDYINDAILEQNRRIEALKQTDLFITSKYPQTKSALLQFEAYQKGLIEDIEMFMRFNGKIKNSYNFLISTIGKLEFDNKADKESVAKALREMIRIRNSMKMDGFEQINNTLGFLSQESNKQKKLLKVHLDLLQEYVPSYIKLTSKLLENKASTRLLDELEQSIHLENIQIVDAQIKEFYYIIIFTFLVLILLAYYISKVEKDKNHIIKLQEDYNRSLTIDTLTGLKNRSAYLQDVMNKKSLYVLQLNIVEFSNINALYGQINGDKLLQQLGKYFQKLQSSNVQVYRHGSDKFLMVMKEFSLDKALAFSKELIHSLENEKFRVDNLDEAISLNFIGGLTSEKPYMVTSDHAMRSIKNSFDTKVQVFRDSMIDNKKIQENIVLIGQIKEAFKCNNFVPLFQPIVEVGTGKTVKYEALIRMRVEDRLISPFFFLELCKKIKLYSQITKIVLNKSIEAIKEKNIDVSINLSIEDINHPDTSFYIKQLLKQNQDIASKITFEILESEEVDNFDVLKEFIKDVKEFGCKIAIDDFGSGFSNYSYLVDLDVDIIKIDASLIKNIHLNENSKLIVKSIVQFAQDVGIKVVAEFVSSEEIVSEITKLNIDLAQGYYYSEPLLLEKLS